MLGWLFGSPLHTPEAGRARKAVAVLAALVPGLFGVLGLGYIALGAHRKGWLVLGAGIVFAALFVYMVLADALNFLGSHVPYGRLAWLSGMLLGLLYVEALVGAIRLVRDIPTA